MRSEAEGGAGIKDYGQKDYIRVSKDLPHVESEPWKLICKIPYNCHFQPWIEVEAEEGKVISINSTNPLVLYLTKTENYTTTAGVQAYEAKNWVSGEGAMYTIPAGVKVRAVKYRETGYDTEFAGSFKCNDEDYNVLWTRAVRTAYICMRNHFYDCPDRERVGFWGDGTPELNQCFYAFDTKSHQLCKELVRRPLQPKFYPGQHLEFLGDSGLWFYYLQTGDIESMREVYAPTKTFLFETYTFGKKTWFDWGKKSKDLAVIEKCFYYNCLGTLKKIAQITGHEADIPEIEGKMEAIRKDFDTLYWKGGFYMSEQVTEPDDRANAMAVHSGLADPSKYQAIYDNVLTKTTNASCFFDRWVFEALCKMGKEEYAMLRMEERYRTMIPSTFTTLWEHYDRIWVDKYDDASSLNHGWNPPAIVLSQTIAGVTPVKPGWETFQVLPKESFLTSINVVVPTVKGTVTVNLEKTATEYGLTVTAPNETTAIVGIPKKSFTELKDITFNGGIIWQGGVINPPKGVALLSDDADYVKFTVPAGTWKFVGRGSVSLKSPKVPGVKKVEVAALDKKKWKASASVPDGTFAFSGKKIPIDTSAANALDGDHWTGWRDMTKKQYPGQWFQVDMQQVQSFSSVKLDNTWALWDYPVGYEITVSVDGVEWSKPVASGAGKPGINTIKFPTQKARYLRITQTGTSELYNWSIYEFDVFE